MSGEEPKDSIKDKADPTEGEENPENGKDEAAAADSSHNVADLDGKVEILCNEPLPLYNSGPNKAYRAFSKDRNRTPLIAIVCERHLVPRRAAATVYSAIINSALANLVLHGAVYWPSAKKELYVFIYFDNLGQPLLQPGGKAALGWKQDEVMAVIVKPMVDILQDFRDKDFVHGGIRPDNMFGGGAAGKSDKIILGDCLSLPPSYAQPALYEPIHRSMTDPIARGKGTPADDLYALGVSIAVLMRQHDPMAGLTDKEVIIQKMTSGSYAAVTGKDRFKGEILELLRGVLHDDPGQRWTIDEVLEWLDGRRLSPKQASAIKKAPRPFVMGEGRYFFASFLAMDLEDKVKETKKVVEDETLLTWVERSLEDEELSERLQKAIVDARQQSTGVGYENCLASNISIALDPEAPLRFKGTSVMGDGIGAAMVQAITLKSSVAGYTEIFLNSLVLNWLTVQNNMNIDVTALFGKFEKCRRFLKTSKYGEGIERAIYVLSPESSCLSEAVKEYFIVRPDDLLNAFEDLCQKGKPPKTFLDQHSVAFLYEKDPKVIETQLYDLNTHENHRILAANLKCMAAIQKRYGMGNMPGIAKILAPKLNAVVKRYHDRRVQEKLRESVVEFQGTGDLKKLAGIFDNAEVVKKDFTSFRRAMQEFHRIEKERQKLEMSLQNKDNFGIAIGKEVSAIISSILAFVIILASAFMFLSDKSPF